jgi:hypothetical protein
MSSFLLLSLACVFPPIAEDTGSTRAPASGNKPEPEDSGNDDTATDGTAGDDTAIEEEPEPAWVSFLAPADGATVANPVGFTLDGEGVDRLVLSADGYEIANWRPAASGWEVEYSFSGTGYERQLTVTGYAADGSAVASATSSVTVEADGVNLDVPYFYQYDNRYEPSGTCGVTSTAMAINYWIPNAVTPDDLYLEYGKSQGQSPSGIASIQRSEGLYADSTTSGTRAEIRAHLDAGRPVVVHGYWTGEGHITVIVGYDDNDWIVNDPAGDWYVCYGCGEADHVRYPRGGAWDDELSYDGDVWYSVSSKRAF